MTTFRSAIWLLPILLFPFTAQSQSFCGPLAGVDDPGSAMRVKDSIVLPEPYPKTREADVMWMKRGKSRIDLREKRNRSLKLPDIATDSTRSLFDVLLCAIVIQGTLTAYEAGPTGADESFSVALSPQQVMTMIMRQSDTLAGFASKPKGDDSPISTQDVVIYEVKEIWFFDSRTNEMTRRVIGLCPMVSRYDKEGIFRGYQPLFWVYYPQARGILANAQVHGVSRNNPALANYDALFQSRYLNRTVIEQSTVNPKGFLTPYNGREALIKSEAAATQVQFLEADFWSY